VEATHAVITNPTAKVTLTPEQWQQYAAAHVPGFPKVTISPEGVEVSGAILAQANETANSFHLAQLRHDEVTDALKQSDDPKVKALADRVPTIGSLLDDPRTGAGLASALNRYQKYVSHSDQHGQDLFESLQQMSQPSKSDGKGGMSPNPDAKYAPQIAAAFGGWDVLKAYHNEVIPLQITNEGQADDMLASSTPGSRAYKYAQRWLRQQTQQKADTERALIPAKAATAAAETKAKQAALASSARNEDGTWNMASLPVQLVEGNVDPSQLSKRSADYDAKLEAASQYSIQKYGRPFDIAQAQSDYKFATNANTQNTLKYLNSLTGADNKSGNLGTLVSLSNKINRTDLPALNNGAAWAKLQTGDPQMAAYYGAVTEVADQVAKIMQGGGTGNGTSDAKLKQAADLFKTGFSKDQITAVSGTLRELLANRKSELVGSNRYLLKQYSPLTNLHSNPQTGQTIGWNGTAWVDTTTRQPVK
jgi:hypothetical protein